MLNSLFQDVGNSTWDTMPGIGNVSCLINRLLFETLNFQDLCLIFPQIEDERDVQ
jgi:hypothetical protein